MELKIKLKRLLQTIPLRIKQKFQTIKGVERNEVAEALRNFSIF